MEKLNKKPLIAYILNIILLFAGTIGLIVLMVNHNTANYILSEFNPITELNNQYLYYLFHPYLQSVYILIIVLFIGKEFILKKPIKIKVAINVVSIGCMIAAIIFQVFMIHSRIDAAHGNAARRDMLSPQIIQTDRH